MTSRMTTTEIEELAARLVPPEMAELNRTIGMAKDMVADRDITIQEYDIEQNRLQATIDHLEDKVGDLKWALGEERAARRAVAARHVTRAEEVKRHADTIETLRAELAKRDASGA
jgi:predicted  nucleic acid-binding Zn-ribbon protein